MRILFWYFVVIVGLNQTLARYVHWNRYDGIDEISEDSKEILPNPFRNYNDDVGDLFDEFMGPLLFADESKSDDREIESNKKDSSEENWKTNESDEITTDKKMQEDDIDNFFSVLTIPFLYAQVTPLDDDSSTTNNKPQVEDTSAEQENNSKSSDNAESTEVTATNAEEDIFEGLLNSLMLPQELSVMSSTQEENPSAEHEDKNISLDDQSEEKTLNKYTAEDKEMENILNNLMTPLSIANEISESFDDNQKPNMENKSSEEKVLDSNEIENLMFFVRSPYRIHNGGAIALLNKVEEDFEKNNQNLDSATTTLHNPNDEAEDNNYFTAAATKKPVYNQQNIIIEDDSNSVEDDSDESIKTTTPNDINENDDEFNFIAFEFHGLDDVQKNLNNHKYEVVEDLKKSTTTTTTTTTTTIAPNNLPGSDDYSLGDDVMLLKDYLYLKSLMDQQQELLQKNEHVLRQNFDKIMTGNYDDTSLNKLTADMRNFRDFSDKTKEELKKLQTIRSEVLKHKLFLAVLKY